MPDKPNEQARETIALGIDYDAIREMFTNEYRSRVKALVSRVKWEFEKCKAHIRRTDDSATFERDFELFNEVAAHHNTVHPLTMVMVSGAVLHEPKEAKDLPDDTEVPVRLGDLRRLAREHQALVDLTNTSVTSYLMRVLHNIADFGIEEEETFEPPEVK